MSDADYSSLNEPNEEALEQMMDSALALANTLGSGPAIGYGNGGPIYGSPRGRRWRKPSQADVDAWMASEAQGDRPLMGEIRPEEYGAVVRGEPRYFFTEPGGQQREISKADYERAVSRHLNGQPNPVPPKLKKELPPPPERAARYAEAMAKILAEPSEMGVGAQAIIARSIEHIEREVATLRGVAGLPEHAIVSHALTSIELGLLGLAKVVEHGQA